MIDFMIIGAGKSGTTSLYYYLAQHPAVFLSPDKEPRYFMLPGLDVDTTQEQRAAFLDSFSNAVSTREAYLRLFRDARPGQLRGEASIQYLNSETAAINIGRHAPDARLICVLRNPIERAFSNFVQGVRDGAEKAASIGEVLARHGARHFYFDGGYYAEQLDDYARHAPRNPLRIWLYEEFLASPLSVVQEMFGFLGVDARFAPDTRIRANVSGLAAPGNRWSATYDWLRGNRLRQSALGRRLLPAGVKRAVVGFLSKRADAGRIKPRISDADWRSLSALYEDDLRQLEAKLGRDLSHWRRLPLGA